MQQARRLMLEHNIRERDTRVDDRDFTFAHVGPVKARHDEHERVLASILTKHFFVEAIWTHSFRPLEGRRGAVLEICGTRANVRMAERARLPPAGGRGRVEAPPRGACRERRSRPPHLPGGRDARLPRQARARAASIGRAGPRVGRRRGRLGVLPPTAPAGAHPPALRPGA
ncbi:MAG: hypothetical protein IPL19_32485 [Sandaracinaceae bacterium]|nr:hypothetical protein [Sandaracinaceae bacterium]